MTTATRYLTTDLGAFIALPYTPHYPHPPQEAFLAFDGLEAFYGGAAGPGKALALDTPLATPDGWTTMGDVEPGDELFDERGHACMVLAASEVMHSRQCFRVRFSDGAEIVADGDHLWATLTYIERSQRSKRNPAFRERRRATRTPRGIGKRPDLAARNAATALAKRGTLLAAPVAELRTTTEIAATLTARHGTAANHAVAVAAPLHLPRQRQIVDPYVLGVWLGDGNTAAGTITVGNADQQVVELLRIAGEDPRRVSCMPFGWKVPTLTSRLKALGVLGHKRIPREYLRGSLGQRIALLQGIVDSDGHIDTDGSVEITWTKRELVDDLMELLASLGIKAVDNESRAMLNGKDCGPRWRIKFLTDLPAARLTRKRVRQKREGFRGTHRERYIVAVEPVESVPVRCVKVDSPSRLYLAGREMVPTHNSDALLMAALQYVHTPRYAAILFRRTYEDLSLPGALIPRSKEWLGPTLGMQAWNEQRHRWTFPSGATLSFGYLHHADDHLRYQGAEFQFVGVDEASQVRENQLRYLFSRLRKPDVGALSDVPLRMRLASNPGDRSHEYLKRRYIDKQVDPDDAEDTEQRARRRVFIRARLQDNPSLDQRAYRESLSHLEPEVRAQLLDGDWDARQPGDWYFEDGHLAAVAALGRELEASIGDLSFVAGESKHLGVDWGDHTHGCLGLQLEAGGWFIAREFVGEASEPSESTKRLLALGHEFDLPWGRVFFDGAGKSSQLTFNATADRLLGWARPRAKAIHFGAQAPRTAATARRSMKGVGCTYLRRLSRRTAEGGGVQVLGISPRCPVLLRQLKAIQRDHESVDGKWLKDDEQHGPDAAVALVTTTATRHRAPAADLTLAA